MFKKLTFFLLVTFAIIAVMPFTQFDGTVCVAQDMPKAMDIVKDVRVAQIPLTSYEVSVTQTILIAPSGSNSDLFPVHTGMVNYFPEEGLSRVPSEKSKAGGESPVPTVMVDLGIFLDELSSFSGVVAESVVLNGSPHYLLQGQDANGTKEIQIWVNQDRVRISRIQFSITNRPFAEIDCEYGDQQNGHWLPSKIVIHHFTDDSQIALDFTGYSFK